jgi:hypothetical protein
LFLDHTPITTLPESLNVKGGIDLSYSKIEYLPDNLRVRGLDLEATSISTLPNNMNIIGILNVKGTPLSEKYTADEIKDIVKSKGGYVNFVKTE